MPRNFTRLGTRSMHCSSLLAVACLTLAIDRAGGEPNGFLDGRSPPQPGSPPRSRRTAIRTRMPSSSRRSPLGKIQAGDVLIDNFNDRNNLQGLGSTIVTYTPATKQLSLFAAIPRNLPQCPGGVGLTTAMAMLKSGWVIVGSLPSQDGTTKTKGQRLPDRARRPAATSPAPSPARTSTAPGATWR